jgi:hypothetical protein
MLQEPYVLIEMPDNSDCRFIGSWLMKAAEAQTFWSQALRDPRLPVADRQPRRAFGQPGDLPVPVQGACAHAKFFDHAGLPKRLR